MLNESGDHYVYESGQNFSRATSGIVLVLVLILGWFIFELCIPISIFTSQKTEEVTYVISKGSSLSTISHDLSELHLIRNRTLFETVVISLGGERNFSYGVYVFNSHESLLQIGYRIARRHFGIEQIKVTVPEGSTVKDIGTILETTSVLSISDEFIKEATKYEGYLFPETYFFFPGTSEVDIIDRMRNVFDQKTAHIKKEAEIKHASFSSIVIMASLIEKEAKTDEERPIIAGILQNRLNSGMPLQVDATLLYNQEKVTANYKSVNNPYDTYTHKGLPPTPISNPGIVSMQAALSPSKTPYFYYLHDENGVIHYAISFAEHKANIRKYLHK